MTPGTARLFVIGGLLLAVGSLSWPPSGTSARLFSLPLVLLALLGLSPSRRWGAWVAIFMIPYLSAAIMNLLAGPLSPVRALGFSVGVTLAGLAGLDWLRRSGVSLRS